MSDNTSTPTGLQDASDNNSQRDGFDRIFSFLGYMFARHDPGEKTPPMPAELAEWAQDTMLATAAGMLLGGGMQWRDERAAGPIQAPPDAPSKAHAAKAMAEEQTQRLLRIINSSLKSSIRFGSLAAVFYGVQLAGGIYRGRHDFVNSAVGGMAAGAVLGSSLLSGKGIGTRGRGAVLGAALGGSIGIPAGMLQDYLVTLLPEDQQRLRQVRVQQTEAIIAGEVPLERPETPPGYDPAGAVIRQLEASLAGSPTGGRRPDDDSSGSGSGSKGDTGQRWKLWGRRKDSNTIE